MSYFDPTFIPNPANEPAPSIDAWRKGIHSWLNDEHAFILEGAESEYPEQFVNAAIKKLNVDMDAAREPTIEPEAEPYVRRVIREWYNEEVVADMKWFGCEYVNSPSQYPRNYDDTQCGEAIRYVEVFDCKGDAQTWFDQYDANVCIVPAYKIAKKMRGFYAMKASQR